MASSPDSPIRMLYRWLASLLVEVAYRYKQSVFDPLFFLITMHAGLRRGLFRTYLFCLKSRQEKIMHIIFVI